MIMLLRKDEAYVLTLGLKEIIMMMEFQSGGKVKRG